MNSVIMTNAFTASAALIAKAVIEDTVEKLAEKYGFDAEEASEFLLSGGIAVKKQLIPEHDMPWCGKVRADCCEAIALNNRRFTQCALAKKNGRWCGKCTKQVESNGTPKWGDVHARLACPILEYSVGKHTVVPYSVYMERNNIKREDVEEAAAAYGLEVDPAQYEKKRRGRPTTSREMIAPTIAIPDPVVQTGPAESASPTASLTVTAHDENVFDCEQSPRQSPRQSIQSRHIEPAQSPPYVPPEDDEDEEGEITATKINNMGASELRAFADDQGIDTKHEGKFIKISELRKTVIDELNLT